MPFVIALFFFYPYLKMNLASSSYYNEQDEKKYEYYTPDLLKKMPRISHDYAFEFGKIDSQQAQVFTVRFYGSTETHVIENYLASAGYRQQSQCDVEAECWMANKNTDLITVIKYTSPESVVVQIYSSRYNQGD